MKLEQSSSNPGEFFSGKETVPEIDINPELLKPIPELPEIMGWKEIKIKEKGEPLVPLGPFSKHRKIFTSSVYYGEHSNSPYFQHPIGDSLITMFVRREVADKLLEVQELLPKNHYLIVLDAYRTLEVQKALFDHYYSLLKQKKPDWTDEELSLETQRYVSLPSYDKSRPSPHNTGGSVDLAIVKLPPEVDEEVRHIDDQLSKLDPESKEAYLLEMKRISLFRINATFLEFGTQFDFGGAEAGLAHFEDLERKRVLLPEEKEAQKNRRLLYNAMRRVGMEPYADEWWHYNSPKSQMGVKTFGKKRAEYGAVELSKENKMHEKIRQKHRQGLIKIQEATLQGYHLIGKVDPLQEYYELNLRALNETGDPRLTHLPKAAKIAPPEAA